MLKKGLFALAATLVLAASSQASVMTLTVTGGGGSWFAYGQLSSDCAGLSSFIINVTADSGLTIASSLNKAPKAMDFEMNLVGFTLSRSNGLLGIGIGAGQVSAYSTPWIPPPGDPVQDAYVLQGVGITAGSYTGLVSTTWTAPVMLASGTYSGAVGWLHVRVGDGQINVLKKVGGGAWLGPGNVEMTTSNVVGDFQVIPEPATMMLVLGGLSTLALRRRR